MYYLNDNLGLITLRKMDYFCDFTNNLIISFSLPTLSLSPPRIIVADSLSLSVFPFLYLSLYVRRFSLFFKLFAPIYIDPLWLICHTLLQNKLLSFYCHFKEKRLFSSNNSSSSSSKTMSSLIICLMILCCSTLVSSQNIKKNVFILARQSNMAGRGGVQNNRWNEVVPPECMPSPQILRFNAKLAWEEAHEPLHADIDTTKVCGIGPGMPFANTVLAKDPSIGVIGLVPCAVGGTPISEWKRGKKLYNDMIQRTKAALNDGGVLRALLWYQGESDSDHLQDAEAYRGRLVELFNNVRADLQSPSLPIIQVALASGGPFKEKIREVQLHTELPNVKCVDADGLPLSGPLHLTTPSQVQLGSMLADAYL